jgi:hypothetical protein
MTNSQRPAAIGTVYFPEPDITPGGAGPAAASGPRTARLRGLPRRRRPAVIALAVAMAGAGVVLSAAVYQRADHQVSVVMVTRSVPAGAVITDADLGTASVAVGSGVEVIPAAQLRQVAGEVAAVGLRPLTLLAPSELTTSRPPGPGQAIVAAPIRPADLPASGLAPGDDVLIVATPGDQGQAGTGSAAPALAAPTPAVIEAVDGAPDSEGFDVVDLLISEPQAAAVASQVSTGQFALVVTKRG